MVSISLVGDIFISRRLPEKGYVGFQQLSDFIQSHDVRFGNLETTIHRNEGYPAMFPGGGWAMASPECLSDLKRFGFNLLSTANNHAMDYSHNGLLATMNYLRQFGFVHAGTGRNLAEASAPVYLECPEGRVALIACTCSFHDSYAAGNQRYDMQGRPGVNPLRHKAIYEITQDDYITLNRMADTLGINDYHDQATREGYLPQSENLNFGSLEFKIGEDPLCHTYPLKTDMDRISAAIAEARRQADYVIVSMHSHQFSAGKKEEPAEFAKIFSRNCIDVGATIVVGHGPHVVRDVEQYKDGIIFYGLGNFIFENETVQYLPAEYFEKYSMQRDSYVGEGFDKRSEGNTKGLAAIPEVWKGMVASLRLSGGKIESFKTYTVDLGYGKPRSQRGLPVFD